MYELHWGLTEPPFRGSGDPPFFFPSPTHEEALARLLFLVENRRRVGILAGESGGGKSMLMRMFRQQLRNSGRQAALVGLLGLDSHGFLWSVCAELGLNPSPGDAPFAMWRMLTDRITENRYQRLDTILLLDDADGASEEVLSHILRLAQCDASPDARLTMVLSADAARCGRLGEALIGLSELRIEIEPWEVSDTGEYLTHSLTRAGRPTPVFVEPAVSRLHELTGGVPRRVSQLAELALLAGAGQQLERIDDETVEAAFEELGVGGPS